MTVEIANTATGELISEGQVRASIRRVIDHAESIWDEWAWQVENQTWVVLGYDSWDEMRRGEYGALTSVAAPRAERPELVARFRGAGLTQQQTAETLGVSRDTVKRHDEPTYAPREPKGAYAPFADADIVDAEIVRDVPDAIAVQPRATPRRALTDVARDLGIDLRRLTERVERFHGDDRFARNKNEVAAHLRHHLAHALQVLTDLEQEINSQEEPSNG